MFVIILILFGFMFREVNKPPSITGAGGGMRAFRRPGEKYIDNEEVWR